MYKIGLKLWSTNTDCYLREAKRLYADGCFDYIELFVVPGSLETLQHWCAWDIPYVLHHAHSAKGFNPTRKERFAANERIAAETREFAVALHPKYIIFHGGADGELNEAVRQLNYFKETYFPGQEVLIENKPILPVPNRLGLKGCCGATIEELDMLTTGVNCGLCLDFGHAVCSANSQRINPYAFIRMLHERYTPRMYHLSDVSDMSSPYDAHPHLGTGTLDIARLCREVLADDAMVSIETVKDSLENLEDFRKDVSWIRRFA